MSLSLRSGHARFLIVASVLAGCRAPVEPTLDAIRARIEAKDDAGAAAALDAFAEGARRAHREDPAGLAEAFGSSAEVAQGAASPSVRAKAADLLVEAVALLEKEPDVDSLAEGRALSALSGLYFVDGRYADAEGYQRRAVEILTKRLGRTEPRTLLEIQGLSTIVSYLGRFREAADLVEQALSAPAPSPDVHADLLLSLGEVRRLQGRYREAEAAFQEGIRLAEGTPGAPPALLASLNNSLAGIYKDQGDYARAEAPLVRSLEIERTSGPSDPEARALGDLNMGDLRRMQGRYDEAEPLLVRGLSEARAIYSEASERLPWYLQQVAMLRREQRRLSDAESLMRDALARRRRLLPAGHPDTAQSAHDLAGLLAESGRFDEAMALYREAIEARRGSFGVDAPEVAVSSIALADALWKRPNRDPVAVLALLDEALPILESSAVFPESRVDGERLRAEVLRASDRSAEAFDALDGAIRLAEALRPNAGSGERERADLWRRRLGLFHAAVVWRVEDGDAAGALASAERARSRVLLDQLEAARIDARAKLAPALREQLETRESDARARQFEARSRLEALARSSLDPGARNREIASLREELTSVSTELARVGEELRRAAYASGPGRFAAPSSADPRALARTLAGRGAALVYLVTSDQTLLFIVTATGDVQAHVLRVDAEQSRALGIPEGPLTAGAVASIMTDPDHGLRGGLTMPAQTTRGFGVLRDSNPGRAMTEDELYRRLRALADILLPDTARRAAERARRLLIVPDGLLQLLPFEALVVAGEPARPEFALDVWPPVRYAPSAAVLQQLERRRAGRASVPLVLLAVADPVEASSTASTGMTSVPLLATTGGWASILGHLPPLPGARQEVARASEAWTRMRGARAIKLVGASATESALRSKIAQARVVQLATHGIASEAEASVLAGLVFAPGSGIPQDDGLLQLHEVYDLPLRADLAILSACSTQVGRNVEGEGVLSLSRAFLAAGADRVASTLWPVEDEDMNGLIGAMFDRMAAKGERGGLDYGAALRDAKLVIRNDEARRHPYHWAGTTIMGLN